MNTAFLEVASSNSRRNNARSRKAAENAIAQKGNQGYFEMNKQAMQQIDTRSDQALRPLMGD